MKHFKQFLLLLVLALFSTSGAWSREIDLAAVESEITLQDGDVIYGTINKLVNIYIDDGATITLRDVKIDFDELSSIITSAGTPALKCLGSCTIILEGTNNYLKGYLFDGIQISDKLTIKGDGKLEAYGGSLGYGISASEGLDILSGSVTARGSRAGIRCKESYTVNIYGDYVEARGGSSSAGIGGNSGEKCGTVNIYGGEVKAYGGAEAPGIGSGQGLGTSCIAGGTVNIYGGYVEAHGGSHGAGIGAGDGGAGGNITIYGGEVKAYGGVDGAGIGGGEGGNSGTIKIYGGKVYAESTGDDSYGAGIGAGEDGDCSPVYISGGEIHAKGGELGHAVGTNNNTTTAVHFANDLVAWTEDGNISSAEDRSYFCCSRRDVHINICDHDGASFTNNGNGTHTVSECEHCSVGTRTEYHFADADGQCKQCHGQVFAGSGTSDAPYQLTNETYPSFAQGIQYVNDFSGKYFQITEDITTSMMANGTFKGTLDGAGHTVTLTLGSEDNYLRQSCALFNTLDGATIKNLHIAGSIYSSAKYNAGIACSATGTNTIEGCVSSVSINSNKNGDCTNGGFIGNLVGGYCRVTFYGCAFLGEMIGENASNWGGFIGWCDYMELDTSRKATIMDCLFAPTQVNVDTSTGNSRTFGRTNNAFGVICGRCFYTTVLQEADGGTESLTSASSDVMRMMTKDYGLVKAYKNGISCDGKYYYISMPQGQGTWGSPYLIGNATEWKYISDYCSAGYTLSGEYLKLTGDFTANFIVGGGFSGRLDGNGHTITLELGNSWEYLDYVSGLFGQIRGATILNLRIAGSIYSNSSYNGSLAGSTTGTNLIENCVSTVSIHSNITGEGINGGFIGIMNSQDSRVTFYGCAFLGQLIGEHTTSWGGFIGWRDYHYNDCRATFEDCLFAPTQVNVDTSTGNCRTFCRAGNQAKGVSFTNCYYTTVLQEADGGTDCISTSILPDDIGTEGEDYGIIKAYANGLKCDDLYYVHSDHFSVPTNAVTGTFAGNWCTYYNSTSNLQVDDNTTIYTINEASGATATLHEVSGKIVKAGQGVILKSTDNSNITLTYTSAAATDADYTGNQLAGVDVQTTISTSAYKDKVIYTLAKEGDDFGFFKYYDNVSDTKYTTNTTLGANKAFLPMDAAAAASARGFVFSLEGETTGINTVQSAEFSASRASEARGRGQSYYTMDGRQLSGKPSKAGLYIVNGRKVVIK